MRREEEAERDVDTKTEPDMERNQEEIDELL
jgi:hypothetical protein